ncbi:MAG: glutamate--tRNA ligase, partial [Cyanobacteria bacterium J06598_1]
HEKPAEELLPMLMPYWGEAGYGFDAEADQDWLLPLVSMIGPSLTRLKDCVELGHFFATPTMDFSDKAKAQLQQDGVGEAMQAVVEALKETPINETSDAKGVITQVTKALGVKKGLVMRSLRAALMGDMQGPDLVESWVILHRRGFDQQRLTEAVAIATA